MIANIIHAFIQKNGSFFLIGEGGIKLEVPLLVLTAYAQYTSIFIDRLYVFMCCRYIITNHVFTLPLFAVVRISMSVFYCSSAACRGAALAIGKTEAGNCRNEWQRISSRAFPASVWGAWLNSDVVAFEARF